MSHRLQGSRFELKYIVDEPRARAIHNFIRCYLVPDEHADPRSNFEYAVHSLYLDSPSLDLYQATVRGLRNRFKLRLRFYDEAPENPVYFEIKSRQNDVILKQRAAVKRSEVPRLLAGHWPRREDLLNGDDRAFGSLQRFCSLRDMLQARGKVLLSYLRQAHVSPEDESVRVTFDRRLIAGPYRGVFGLNGLTVRGLREGAIILELKFTNRFPVWMHHLVRTFDLERRSVAKYVTCAQTLGGQYLRLAESYKE